jgi:hypothetical protein
LEKIGKGLKVLNPDGSINWGGVIKGVAGIVGGKKSYDDAKEANKAREEHYNTVITPIRTGLVNLGAGVGQQQGALQAMLTKYMQPGFTAASPVQRTAQPIKTQLG